MSYRQDKWQEHISVFQIVTNYVISELEKELIPWEKGWSCYGPPINIYCQSVFHGWNSFFLNHITTTLQYKTPFFLTYNQAKEMGGHIPRNEKGYPVIYWKKLTTDYKALKGGINETDEKKYPKSRLILKAYTVFNIDQTKGIDFDFALPSPKNSIEKIQRCEQVVQYMPQCPPIRHGGDHTSYYVGLDYIQMPHLEQFHFAEHYYQALFRELIHSTGHPFRLNRKELEFFILGDDRCAREELIEELGAAYLCAHTGIENIILEDRTAYINSWIQRLQNDKTLLIKAASQAQAAVSFILNQHTKDSEMNDFKNIAV